MLFPFYLALSTYPAPHLVKKKKKQIIIQSSTQELHEKKKKKKVFHKNHKLPDRSENECLETDDTECHCSKTDKGESMIVVSFYTLPWNIIIKIPWDWINVWIHLTTPFP